MCVCPSLPIVGWGDSVLCQYVNNGPLYYYYYVCVMKYFHTLTTLCLQSTLGEIQILTSFYIAMIFYLNGSMTS